jgi:hypothetical protein
MSRFPNRRWLVIPASEVENINFNQVLESSLDSLRYSVDQSETFVKYEVTVVEQTYTETYFDPITQQEVTQTVQAGVYGRPDIYSEEFTEYDHQDILELLSTEAWTAPLVQTPE